MAVVAIPSHRAQLVRIGSASNLGLRLVPSPLARSLACPLHPKQSRRDRRRQPLQLSLDVHTQLHKVPDAPGYLEAAFQLPSRMWPVFTPPYPFVQTAPVPQNNRPSFFLFQPASHPVATRRGAAVSPARRGDAEPPTPTADKSLLYVTSPDRCPLVPRL